MRCDGTAVCNFGHGIAWREEGARVFASYTSLDAIMIRAARSHSTISVEGVDTSKEL